MSEEFDAIAMDSDSKDTHDTEIDNDQEAMVPEEEVSQAEEAVGLDQGAEDDDQELTDEMLDTIADTAIAALQDILKYFNVGDLTIDEYEGDEGELILDITGDDLAVLIGRHGKTLDALQFIISSITVRKIGFRYPVVVDVEGYKNRQRQKLESIAYSTARRAVTQHHDINMRPMTPYERRIIHIALRDNPDVETFSEGEGASRHVVVRPL